MVYSVVVEQGQSVFFHDAGKFARGEYTLGKADQYGQRIDIKIELAGIGDAAGKPSHLRSGRKIQPDGSININTPFSGFTR